MQKLDKIYYFIVGSVLILSGCTGKPVHPATTQEARVTGDICIVIETKDLLAPVAMTTKEKDKLKSDISNRTQNYLTEFFTSKNVKAHTGDDCQPEHVKLFVNYMTFEVGNDSNDFLFISWSEKDKVKIPYKLKAEVTLYSESGEQAWADEQLKNGIDLDSVIKEISTAAASHVEISYNEY